MVRITVGGTGQQLAPSLTDLIAASRNVDLRHGEGRLKNAGFGKAAHQQDQRFESAAW
jgi:hypothetical protein